MFKVEVVGIFWGLLGSGSVIFGYLSRNFVCDSSSSQAFLKVREIRRFLFDVVFVLLKALCSCGIRSIIVLAFKCGVFFPDCSIVVTTTITISTARLLRSFTMLDLMR